LHFLFSALQIDDSTNNKWAISWENASCVLMRMPQQNDIGYSESTWEIGNCRPEAEALVIMECHSNIKSLLSNPTPKQR